MAGKVKFALKSTAELLRKRKLEAGGGAQVFVDSEVLRRCARYVPFDSGALKRSGVTETKLGSGEVRYRTPYARRWYYTDAKFQGAPRRGKKWFERMCDEGGRKAILRGAAKIAGAEAKDR